MSSTAFTSVERRLLIQAIHDARRELDTATWELDRADGPASGDLAAALEYHDQVHKRLGELLDVYEERLPVPAISRDPFTGEVLSYPIDTLGLDGPWWDNGQAVRPVTLLPPTVFALTGAVAITGKPPETPFNVKPGPAVPWVCPRLLALPGMRAVVASIRVGQYLAYPIVYFTAQTPWGHPGINTWGLDTYIARHQDGSGSIEKTWNLRQEYDFELAPWIRRGNLLWIAPGDPKMQLRSLLHGCPYLELEGYRFPVRLQDGVMENCLLDEPGEQADERGT